jgi:hypothetical protein
LEDFCLCAEKPADFPLPDVKLAGEFGQWKMKDWPGDMGRIDNFEKLLDWLPEPGEKGYGDFFEAGVRRRAAYMPPESFKMFSFVKANLYRVYGDQWEET